MSRDERQEVCVTSSLLSLALGLEGAQSKGRFPEKKTVVLLVFVQTTSSPQFGQLIQLFSEHLNVN